MLKQGLCLSLLTLSIAAQADHFYISPKAGMSFVDSSQLKLKATAGYTNPVLESHTMRDIALIVGGSGGYHWTDMSYPIRLEAEYLYRSDYTYDPSQPALLNETGTYMNGNIRNSTVLANGYVELPIIQPLNIFLGAGLGWSVNNTDGHFILAEDISRDHRTSGFSWMATIGLSAILTDYIDFDMSYRYSSLGEASWEVDASKNKLKVDNLNVNEVLFAFRFHGKG